MKPFRVVVRLLPRSGYYRDASASWGCPGCGAYNRCHWWRDAMDSAYEHALTCEWLAVLNDNPAKWAGFRVGGAGMADDVDFNGVVGALLIGYNDRRAGCDDQA